ncbi:kinase-like domain-containing protein [Thelephora terrestris]|uniref:Kinase-like domain-containing protein n=1 Tax=Thelephora terrestris TaxID=56493 RepID=A0A9P6L8I8_9AGAM|nr:kinase-like domain-containing protein [Thelephora terrestris]
MHPPPAGLSNIPLPPISSEVKSRGVRFPESTALTASPESYETPLPPEANLRVLGLSGIPNTPTQSAAAIDPRLQMIKRRSQFGTRLSSLHSLRMTMGVPFPESGPISQTTFTPAWTTFTMGAGSNTMPRQFSVDHSYMHMSTLAPVIPRSLPPITGSGETPQAQSQSRAHPIEPIPELSTSRRPPPRGYSGMETPYNAPHDEFIADIELKRKTPVDPITGKLPSWVSSIKSKLLGKPNSSQAPLLLGKQNHRAKHRDSKRGEVVLRPSAQAAEGWRLLLPSPFHHNRRTCILPAYYQSTGTLHIIKATRRGTLANRKHATFLLNEWKVLEVLRREGKDRTPYLQGPSKEVNLWAWKDEKALYHVTEFCEMGDLTPWATHLGENRMKLVAVELTAGLRKLHSLGIVHHDIKPDNVFVGNDGHIRIGDFGGSQFLRPGQRLSRHQREQDLIADIEYSAPELFMYDAHGVAYYDESVDWYSLGATLFFLSTGQHLMPPAPNKTTAVQMIRRGPVHAWNNLNGPTEFRNFVTELLLTNPNNRLNDQTVRKHPYFELFSMRSWRKIEKGRFTAPFSDCSAKITNKGYDVFDTPALALSHPLEDADEGNDEEEKIPPSTSDIVEEISQDTENKGPAAVPSRTQQAKVNNSVAFNPTGNYHLSPPFERSFIDLGRLMVEEGFDLSTYGQLQSLLSDEWKFV